MTPLDPELELAEIVQNPHFNQAAHLRRGFKWEVVKQLVEEYWLDADQMERVKGTREQTFKSNRMVLQFKQGRHHYRLAFDLFLKSRTPLKHSYKVSVMTIFHDGRRPALDCDVHVLDGTYDLPTENIP